MFAEIENAAVLLSWGGRDIREAVTTRRRTALFDNIDPRHLAAGAGATIGAGLDFVKNVLSRESGLTLRTALLGAFNFFFQLFAGFCGAIYLSPLVANHSFEILSQQFIINDKAAAFGVGLAFFRFLPLLFGVGEKALELLTKKGG